VGKVGARKKLDFAHCRWYNYCPVAGKFIRSAPLMWLLLHMKKTNVSISATTFFTCVVFFLGPSLALAFRPGTATFHGTQETSIEELIEAAREETLKEPQSDVAKYKLARLHQMAYAQKSVPIYVEIYDEGDEYVPFIERVPIYDDVKESASSAERQKAQEHLEKAIRYYRDVSSMTGPLEFEALMGLCWCIHQSETRSGEKDVYERLLKEAAENTFGTGTETIIAWKYIEPYLESGTNLKPKYLRGEKEGISLKHKLSYSIWGDMARLHALVYAEKSRQVYVCGRHGVIYEHENPLFQTIKPPANDEVESEFRKDLFKAIELYEKLLGVSESEHKSKSDDHPLLVERYRMTAKMGLAWARSQVDSRGKTVARLRELLEEAIAYDKKTKSSGCSIEVWRFMRTLLDPEKDASEIQRIEKRFRQLQLKSHIPTSWFILERGWYKSYLSGKSAVDLRQVFLSPSDEGRVFDIRFVTGSTEKVRIFSAGPAFPNEAFLSGGSFL
jgi:hypothetical protein